MGLLGKLLRAFRPAGKSEEDIQELKAAAEAGDAAAQYELAMMYGLGKDVERDDALTLEWGRKAAGNGHPEAQLRMGQCCLHGTHDQPQDLAQAVEWFRKAAEQGLASAQFNLADCYLEGKGVAQDEAKAAAWFRKAAEQGFLPAQGQLLMVALSDLVECGLPPRAGAAWRLLLQGHRRPAGRRAGRRLVP